MDGARSCGLLLAGGVGSRLWPVSTERRPKQFVSVLDQPLIVASAGRLTRHVPLERVFVATTVEGRALVEECLPALPPDNVLVEPSAVGTLPAFALSCARIEHRVPGATVLAMPTDSHVDSEEAFAGELARLLETVRREPDVVAALGAAPTSPDTGMGYLTVEPRDGQAHVGAAFTEKPGPEQAEQLVAAGARWNTACYAFRTPVLLAAFRERRPAVTAAVERLLADDDSHAYDALRGTGHELVPVFEAGVPVRVEPSDCGWRDVGGWASLLETKRAEEGEGVVVFDGSSSPLPVHTAGLTDAVVIRTDEGIYVLHPDVLTSPERLDRLRGSVERENGEAQGGEP